MSNVISLGKAQGFTRMDNDLYEALIGADLSGRELRVALAIHRQTAGYNIDTARIAASYIAKMSGIHREDVSRAICELIRQRVIFRIGGSRSPIGFAPISEWAIDKKNTHKNKPKEAPQCGVSTTSNVAFLPHNKDSKDNLVPTVLAEAPASTPKEQIVQAEDQEPKKPTAERIPYAKIVDLYNRTCGHVLPKCAKLTDKRRKLIAKVWNFELFGDYPFRGNSDFWEGYFNDCLTNKHWTGSNDRGWCADIDFILREDKVLKVLEAM